MNSLVCLIREGAQLWIGFGSVLVLLWIQFGVSFGLGLDLNQVTTYMLGELLDLFWSQIWFWLQFGFGLAKARPFSIRMFQF